MLHYEAAGFVINKFVGLKPKRNSFFIDDNNEHKKQRPQTKMLLQREVSMNINMFSFK